MMLVQVFEVLTVLLCCVTHVSAYVGGVATSCDNSSLISLQCNQTQMIHVIQEIYGTRAPTKTCHLSTTDPCIKYYMDDRKGLVVTCNGRQNCREYVNSSLDCTPRSPAFQINFACVEDSMNMCNSVKRKSVNGTVYFHSPGFPDSVGEEGNCSCWIGGFVKDVMIIHQQTSPGVFKMSAEKSHLWSKWGRLFNRNITIVHKLYDQFSLEYDNKGMHNENVWIRIKGSGSMLVTCKGWIRETTSTSLLNTTVKHSTKSSTTAMSPTTKIHNLTIDTNNSVTVISAVCSGIALLILVVLLSVIIMRRCRNRAGVPNAGDGTNKTSSSPFMTVMTVHYENVTNELPRNKQASIQKASCDTSL